MKYPKPTDGVTKHCWGKRRRIAKKVEKGLWKAMSRLGILDERQESAEDCSWEDGIKRHGLPCICSWSGPDYCGEYSESPTSFAAMNHLNAPSWERYDYDEMDGRTPDPIAKSDRHALQLLRSEIKRRKLEGRKG